MNSNTQKNAVQTPISGDLAGNVTVAVKKAAANGRGFVLIMLQIAQLASFRKRRSPDVVSNLLRELYQAARTVVHPSQYVGIYKDGIGLIFEGVDPGRVDDVVRKLIALGDRVIKDGHYNDMSMSLTDLLYQLLTTSPSVMYTEAGWSVYPRDGGNAADIIKRAAYHMAERGR